LREKVFIVLGEVKDTSLYIFTEVVSH